jgi:thioredoxin-dependent peroxiredoxin
MRFTALPALGAALLAAGPTLAALPVGAPAPAFTTDAALAGKATRFSLADALRRGPVVLYFFPKPFTSGCTVEAHAFSEASAEFAKQGATLIGLSAGTLDGDKGLKQFSTLECRDKFAVGVATPAIIQGYDVRLKLASMIGATVSDRTSYVIAPDGKVIFAYSAMDPAGHVEKTLAAVKAWKAAHPRA